MPATVEVAAFVFGLLLMIFAILGQSLKVKDVAVADLSPWQRAIAGMLGVTLLVIGLNQGRLPALISGPVRTNAAASAPTSAVGREATALSCLPTVAAENLLTMPIERSRRVKRNLGSGQPRSDQLVVQFQSGGTIIGGMVFTSSASGSGFDIMSVVNQRCEAVTTYANASRPNQPANAPYAYDVLTYTIDGQVFTISIDYGKGEGKIWVTSEGR